MLKLGYFMAMKKWVVILAISTAALGDSFGSTWKLLNQVQKEQFIAGYLQGFRDASKITDLTIKYLEENPNNVQQGLKTLQSLYDVEGARPSIIVPRLDEYFKDNSQASLSQALSAVKYGN